MEKKAFGIIFFSILVEGIITYINEFFITDNFSWKMLLSISIGIIVAIAYKLDLPEHLGVTSNIPYIGCVLTGILISRGSNYVYDLIYRLKPN